MSPTRPAQAIDWNSVHRRLEAAHAKLERSMTPDAEETERVLAARARALAREPKPLAADDGNDTEVVEFVVAQERYAFESRHVRTVHPLEQLTPIPCTPPFVLGIVSLRGEIISIVDIKKFFDLPEQGLTDLNKVIVLASEGMQFGVLADAIVGVRRIAGKDIQASLPTLTGIREDYLLGVTPGRTTLLDAERLLMDERIVVNEQVSAT